MTRMQKLAAFVLLALLQLGVVFYMVWHWEDVAQNGRVVHLAVKPVDPYDLLRGRYIDLNFGELKVATDVPFENGEKVYAVFEEENERVKITAVSRTKPDNQEYVNAKVSYYNSKANTVQVMVPFKRYYMPEELAPLAEKLYNRRAINDGVARLRVKNGDAVIEEIYFGDKTIYEHLKDGAAEK